MAQQEQSQKPQPQKQQGDKQKPQKQQQPIAELRRVRIEKMERLRDEGVPVWPERFERTHTLEKAADLAEGTEGVRIGGRVIAKRDMGKLIFAKLRDFKGGLQISLRKDGLDPELFKRFKKRIDIGDHVGCAGRIYRTEKGELTLEVESFEFMGKALRPLPEKWAGVKDVETRLRQRYLDLIVNEEARDRFRLRTSVVRTMRRYLDDHDFEEVETPILATKASGAMARPFTSHHNALDIEVTLRIAPETYLKRLVVGGYDKVYEFARCFRNEGMDPSHLQDFTMLEYYCAWWNYEDNMRFTEELVKHTIKEATGGFTVERKDEDGNVTRTLDFGGESWPRVTMRELIQRDCGIDITAQEDAASLRAAMIEQDIRVDKMDVLGRGALVDQLYKKVSRPKLIDPVFLIQHPTDLSPLARRNDDDPSVVDRFQLVVNGWEVVNAYSELVDPLDQRARLEEQAGLRAAGDDEAMDLDEDYLLAMEHGMPPISGWGMGIDRFVALITGQDSLRETVLFPLMRPE